MPFERLSPLDASFLHVEDGVTHMHIGSVSIMEGPPPAFEDLRDMVSSKLPAVRRCRQIVKRVPFDLGRPVWVDDPYFDIGYHLRHSALPSPGDDTQLRNLVGRLMAQQLDRSRPLWEMWMVEGLPDRRWALVSKVHHCMADGVSGSDLMGLILDPTPDARPAEELPWIPALPPAGWELAVDALAPGMAGPIELGRLVRTRTRGVARVAAHAAQTVGGIADTVTSLRGRSSTSLNGSLGPHRRWVSASVPVAEVKQVRRRFGGTFNDVVLALTAGGLRTMLEKRGDPADLPLRSLVPVSVRPRDGRGMAVGDGTLANRVSAVLAELPVNVADPVARLRAVSAQMSGVRKQALAGEALTSLSELAPPVLLSLAGRLGTKAAQRTINTVTTNVPGPQMPLYALGRRMLEVYPFVPLGMQMRVAVAVFSYDGVVGFGITGDYDTAGDIDVLASGIKTGMSELLSFDPEAVIIDLRPGVPSGR